MTLRNMIAVILAVTISFSGIVQNPSVETVHAETIQPIEVRAKGTSYKVGKFYVGFEKSTGTITWADKGLSYIPKKIDGTYVRSLGDWAFYENTGMKALRIPKEVKSLGKGVFYGAKKLNKVVISSQIESIPEMTFYGCNKIKTVNIPNSVKTIGDYAFYECKKLKEVTFAERSTAKLGRCAFYSCKNLRSVDFGQDNIIELGEYVFYNCTALDTVKNNPDEKWEKHIISHEKALEWLGKQDAQSFVDGFFEYKKSENEEISDSEWDYIKQKADSITVGAKSDTEKARRISEWIVNYLHYDTKWMEQFQEWRKTHDEKKETFPIKKVMDAYGLLTWDPSEHGGETAMTTCGGYSNLTQALFIAEGIPCVLIWREQAPTENIDHEYNAAYVNGKWIFIDNTQTDEDTDYFAPGIAGFSYDMDHRVDYINFIPLSDLVLLSGGDYNFRAKTMGFYSAQN